MCLLFPTATPVVHTDCTDELAGEHDTALMPNSESQRQEDANAGPTIGQQAMSVNISPPKHLNLHLHDFI